MDIILDSSIRSPKKTLLVWLLCLLAIGMNLKPFKMLITIDGLINKNFKSAVAYHELKSTFEEGTPLLILHKNQLNKGDLCSFRTWLSLTPKKSDHIIKTHSLFSLRRPVILREGLVSFEKLIFPQLINLKCYPKEELSFSRRELKLSPWDGLLINNDTFLTEIRFASMGEHNFDSKVIPKIVENAWAQYPKSLKEKSYLLGEAAYQYYMKKGLRQNNLLNGLLLILVVFLMRFFLGTWRAGLIFVSSLIMCALFLFGLMNISNTPLDVLNNSLFILLSVASLGDFIFICHHQRKNNCSWEESFKKLILPSFFTSLTTFLGFISLTTSDLTIIKRLGLWAAFSGVIEWLVIFSLLPALLTFFKYSKPLTIQKSGPSQKVTHFLENYNLPRFFLFFFLAFYVVSPMTPMFFNINDNPTLLFPKDHPFRGATAALKKSLGYSGEVSLVLKSSTIVDEDLKRLVSFFKENKNVAKIESPKNLTDYFTKNFKPIDKNLILSNIKKSSAYTRLVKDGTIRLRIYLKETSLKQIDILRRNVETNLCAQNECHLTGALVAYAEFSQRVPKTLLISLGTSLILVALVILTLALRRQKGLTKSLLAPLMISSFWGVAFVLVIISITQFKLNFVTCVVLAILVGMTGDNAIHYLLASKGDLDEGIASKQGASIMTTMIMSFCCIIFFFFSFEPPRMLGVLLIIGLWGSLVGDLWFLKILIKKTDSRESA